MLEFQGSEALAGFKRAIVRPCDAATPPRVDALLDSPA